MQCMSPINIKKHNAKNATERHLVPCSKCAACLSNRRNDWSMRLKHELELSTSAFFITLTYDNENLTWATNYATLVKSDLTNYIKRLRDAIKPNKFRYYAVGEYGTKTFRPHYHMLIYNYPIDKVHHFTDKWSKEGEPIGFVKVGAVNDASIHYVTKYHVNRTHYPAECEPSYAVMSRKPGIGSGYVEQQKRLNLERDTVRAYLLSPGGFKQRLPRYYKEKLYSREALVRHRLESATKVVHPALDDEKMEEHYRNNPDKNYFEYVFEQFEDFSKKYKEKSQKTTL